MVAIASASSASAVELGHPHAAEAERRDLEALLCRACGSPSNPLRSTAPGGSRPRDPCAAARRHRVVLDLLAQPVDQLLEVLAAGADAASPELADEALRRHGVTGLREQQLQQPQLERGERHLALADAHRWRSSSSTRAPTAVGRGGASWLARRSSARTRASRVRGAEGLGQVVVGAEVEAAHQVLFLAAHGEHEDGHGAPLRARAPQHLEAVDAGG